MGFHESGHTPEFVIRTINTWVEDWLSIQQIQKPKRGLIIRYPYEGQINTEIIKDPQKLNALYKICRCSPYCMFYLLTKIYRGQVSYFELIEFVNAISDKLNKIKETSDIKSEKEREAAKRVLSMDIKKLTMDARLKLSITK